MSLATSIIELHPDRDMIDEDIRDLVKGIGTYKAIAARWNLSIGSIQRRKRALLKKTAARTALDAATSQAASPAVSVPKLRSCAQAIATAPIPAAPVAYQPDAPALTVDVEAPDDDEAANGDPHTFRLRMVNILIAAGRQHKQIAAVFNRSVSTIERWAKQARETKAAAIAKIDGVKQVGDALWTVLYARSQLITNGQECLKKGDLAGHRRAMEAITRNEVARVAVVEKITEMGGGKPARDLDPAEESAQSLKELARRYLMGEFDDGSVVPASLPEPEQPHESDLF
jgi:transposase